MRRANRRLLLLGVVVAGLLAALVNRPVSAQGGDFRSVDFTGYWGQRFHEDAIERGPGPDVGDYLGMPINDAARDRADAWTASSYTLFPILCRQHQTGEIIRSPQSVTMWREIDPITRKTQIWHAQWRRTNETSNLIYMDGRPHPPAEALHTFMGFSTGVMDGDMLTVTTTHMKEGFARRNGVPRSDRQTVVQHFLRRGDVLTIFSLIYDPVYFTEPYVQSSEYVLAPGDVSPPFPCFETEEIARAHDVVPHHLPGTNTASADFAMAHGLPVEAVRGGAVTMYPEFRQKLAAAQQASPARGTNGR